MEIWNVRVIYQYNWIKRKGNAIIFLEQGLFNYNGGCINQMSYTCNKMPYGAFSACRKCTEEWWNQMLKQ